MPIVLHLIGYFLLAGSFLLYFHDSLSGHIEAFILASVAGTALEILQMHLPYRAFSFFDLFINVLGASAVFLDHRVKAASWIIEIEDSALGHLFGGVREE